MNEPIWLQKSVVLAFHEMLLAEHGGAVGIRDEGLLDSALNRPKQYFHYQTCGLHELASLYAIGIIHNHPFVDGNKRTGFVSMKTFLLRNAFTIEPNKEDSVSTFLNLAAGKISQDELAKWIKNTWFNCSRFSN